MKRTTTYGLCPVCHGHGYTYSGLGTARDVTCHYCQGQKRVVVAVTEESEPTDWQPAPPITCTTTQLKS